MAEPKKIYQTENFPLNQDFREDTFEYYEITDFRNVDTPNNEEIIDPIIVSSVETNNNRTNIIQENNEEFPNFNSNESIQISTLSRQTTIFTNFKENDSSPNPKMSFSNSYRAKSNYLFYPKNIANKTIKKRKKYSNDLRKIMNVPELLNQLADKIIQFDNIQSEKEDLIQRFLIENETLLKEIITIIPNYKGKTLIKLFKDLLVYSSKEKPKSLKVDFINHLSYLVKSFNQSKKSKILFIKFNT